jgi:hypothetical protein
MLFSRRCSAIILSDLSFEEETIVEDEWRSRCDAAFMVQN